MLYALRSTERPSDRIRLFPNMRAARAAACDGQSIHEMAVWHDEGGRRVLPLWTDPQVFDPYWSTPAELHADGSITARGPFPEALYGRELSARESHGRVLARYVPALGLDRECRPLDPAFIIQILTHGSEADASIS